LDFVSNHVHINHAYFKEHRNWFGQLELPDGRLNLRFWDELRLTTWFEPYLPSFDYLGSKEALETMTDNAVWWLNETEADGYRHDAVKHVPNEFWRKLNDKIRKEVSATRNLPVYQIGETFGSYELISSYVNNGQLNAQFNFNLYDAAIPTFIKEDALFSNLDKEMQKTFSVYGVNHLMGNVMDSHDKNRFMAYADGDLDVTQWSAIEEGWNNPPMVDNPENYKKLILYMAYMNTIPGLPVIYYGSEFGMSGASDPDNRRMMRFDDQLSEYEKNTLAEVSKIVNIRKEHPALRYGDFYSIQADENIYAYLRSDFNERILVVLNKSNEEQKVQLSLPHIYNISFLKDLNTNENMSIKNIAAIPVSAKSWEIYQLIR
jgi:glycosidase